MFELITTVKPSLVGVLPDCKDTSSFPVYMFFGTRNPTFESQARKSNDDSYRGLKIQLRSAPKHLPSPPDTT